MLQTDNEAAQARRAPTREDHPMAGCGAPAGLCTSCVHAPMCTYPRRDGQSVLCCGEFEGETQRSVAPSATSRVTQPSDPTRAVLPLGLCANCGLYSGCDYPKSEGGVWQCDEYR